MMPEKSILHDHSSTLLSHRIKNWLRAMCLVKNLLNYLYNIHLCLFRFWTIREEGTVNQTAILYVTTMAAFQNLQKPRYMRNRSNWQNFHRFCNYASCANLSYLRHAHILLICHFLKELLRYPRECGAI